MEHYQAALVAAGLLLLLIFICIAIWMCETQEGLWPCGDGGGGGDVDDTNQTLDFLDLSFES